MLDSAIFQNICIASNRVQNRYDGIGRVSLPHSVLLNRQDNTTAFVLVLKSTQTNETQLVWWKATFSNFPLYYAIIVIFVQFSSFLPHIHTWFSFVSFRLKAMLLFRQHCHGVLSWWSSLFFFLFEHLFNSVVRSFPLFLCESLQFVCFAHVFVTSTPCSECAKCCAVLASLHNRIGLTIKI